MMTSCVISFSVMDLPLLNRKERLHVVRPCLLEPSLSECGERDASVSRMIVLVMLTQIGSNKLDGNIILSQPFDDADTVVKRSRLVGAGSGLRSPMLGECFRILVGGEDGEASSGASSLDERVEAAQDKAAIALDTQIIKHEPFDRLYLAQQGSTFGFLFPIIICACSTHQPVTSRNRFIERLEEGDRWQIQAAVTC